jgi:DNA-binding beta-propeller fold protein YncE
VVIFAAVAVLAPPVSIASATTAYGPVARFGVGDLPETVAVDSAGGFVFVGAEDNNTGLAQLTEISAIGRRVLATIPVGNDPTDLAVDQQTHTAYDLDGTGGSIYVIDEVHQVVTDQITLGFTATSIAIDPARDEAWVGDYTDTAVVPVNLSTGALGDPVPLDDTVDQLAVDSATGTLFVSVADGDSIDAVDETNGAVSDIALPGDPTVTALTADEAAGDVFVATAGNMIDLIDVGTQAVVGSASTREAATGLAVDPIRHLLYAAAPGDDDGTSTVSVLTETTLLTVGTFTGPADSAGAVAVDTESGTPYVTDPAASEVLALGEGVVPTLSGLAPRPTTAGHLFAFTVRATGTGPVTYTVYSGKLPAGVVLNSTTGVLTGLANTPGAYAFAIRATSPFGRVTAGYSGAITAPPTPALTRETLPRAISARKPTTVVHANFDFTQPVTRVTVRLMRGTTRVASVVILTAPAGATAVSGKVSVSAKTVAHAGSYQWLITTAGRFGQHATVHTEKLTIRRR